MGTLTDAGLLLRWTRRRDSDAFKALVERYSGMVYATSRRILGDEEAARDVTQDCFLKLASGRLRFGGTLAGWLHTVATNRSLDYLRKEHRRVRREQAYIEELAARPQIEWKDIEPIIDEAIAALPEELKAPLVAHFFAGETHEAIARSLGVTRRAASYRIERAVEAVRDALGKKGIVVAAAVLLQGMESAQAAALPESLALSLKKIAMTPRAGAWQPFISPLWAGAIAMGVLAALISGGAYFGILKTTVPEKIATENTLSNIDSTISDTSGPELIPPAIEPGPAEARSSETPDFSSPLAIAADATDEPLPEPATVSGYVINDRGYPIPGAKVLLASIAAFLPETRQLAGVWSTAVTDSAGHYALSDVALSGSVYLSVTHPEHQTGEKQVNIEEGESIENVNFILKPGVLLNGRVVGDDNTPVADALVQPIGIVTGNTVGAGGDRGKIALTDGDGRFSLGFHDEGEVVLKVVTALYGDAVFNHVPIGIEDTVELRILSTASLAGRVSWKAGGPASAVGVDLTASFRITSEGRGTVSGSISRYSTTTDHDGRYAFDGLPADARYQIAVVDSAQNPLSQPVELGAFIPGEAKTWDHILNDYTRVFGRVTGERTGRPIRFIRLVRESTGGNFDFTYLADSNEYEIRLFEPGTYTIYPEPDLRQRDLIRARYGKEVVYAPGREVELNFAVPDPFALSIQVVDVAGEPIADAQVTANRVLSPGSVTGFQQGRTDMEGRYAFDGFPPEYESWFVIRKDGYVSMQSTPVVGEPGVDYPEEVVVLHASGGVEGKIVDEQGKPVAFAPIKIMFDLAASGLAPGVGDWVRTATDAKGVFAIAEGLPAVTGRLLIEIETDHGWKEAAVLPGVSVAPAAITNLGVLTGRWRFSE